MTLDILHFIDSKDGNAEEIRDSQRKRGHSVELVDDIIQMYADWVKSASAADRTSPMPLLIPHCTTSGFRSECFA